MFWFYLALLVHSLFILAILCVPPPNVFSALAVPINAPIPDLDRLANFELRAFYVRFGHNVLLSCEHCQTFEDYALYAFPRPALAYLREIAFVGLLTLEKLNRSHLRPLAVGILVAAFVTETYLLATAPISIPSPTTSVRVEDTYMWHDQFLFYRRILFLVLPVGIAVLPSIQFYIARKVPIASMFFSRPLPLSSLGMIGLDPQTAHNMHPERLKSLFIQSSLKTADHLIHAVHLGRYTHAALMRDAELRNRAGEWWDAQKEEADAILRDDGVKKAAKVEGLAFGGDDDDDDTEGPLRTSARTVVDELFKRGFAPSEHWASPQS